LLGDQSAFPYTPAHRSRQSRSCPSSRRKKMYEHVFQFFGLRENPFYVSPDPRSYFPRHSSDAALAELILGVQAPPGFIVLTGEAGTGKTTLLNHFLDWLQEQQRSSSYVFHPRLRPLELFEFILRDFGVPCEKRNKRDLLEALRRWLIRRHAMGDSPVVVVDEGQAISVRTLAQLLLLLNLKTEGNKLLHIVLAGQPKLEEELRRQELLQLHQRVTFRCSLPSFSPEETAHFVESRLASATATNVDVFAKESLEAVHTYARGIPRTVNLLCEHALLTAYAEQVKVISPDLIRQVATEFDLISQSADAEGPELSGRFRRLVPLRSEAIAARVAPENATVDSPKAATIVAALTPELHEVVPAPIVMRQTVRLIPKQVEHPELASPKELPVGWQGPSLGQRLVRYCKEVGDSFMRDWKQFYGAYGSGRAAARKYR